MELFFRKYFWTVNIVFVLAVALIAAKTVNLFVEGALAPSAANAPVRASPRAVVAEVPASITSERLSKLTGLPLPPPPVDSGPDVAYNPDAEPVKTSLRLKLIGTLLSVDEVWSVASIQDVAATPQKVGTFMIGDKVQGADVLEIERSRVIIKNNGRKEFIDGEAGDGSMVAVVAPSHEGGMGNGIKELSENQYEVPRAEIDKTLANLNDVAMQARIVPAFKDGVAQGFKLFSIRPDSIYTKIGVVNGDVIKRINGFEMNDPAKALEVYSKLKDASRIDIELERNGSNLHKTYNIR